MGEDGYAQSGDVKIHYVTMGKGPLIVMIHGFPDYWYTWRAQMPELAKHVSGRRHRPARLQPERQARGSRELQDRKTCRRRRGGAVAHFQARRRRRLSGTTGAGSSRGPSRCTHPEKTERLIILNLPHPKGLIARTGQQHRISNRRASTPASFRSPTRPRSSNRNSWRAGSATPKPARSTSRRSAARRWKGCSTTTRRTIPKSRTATKASISRK